MPYTFPCPFVFKAIGLLTACSAVYHDGMGFTVLIVDDEREVCLSLAEVLRSKGYSTLSEEDPATCSTSSIERTLTSSSWTFGCRSLEASTSSR